MTANIAPYRLATGTASLPITGISDRMASPYNKNVSNLLPLNGILIKPSQTLNTITASFPVTRLGYFIFTTMTSDSPHSPDNGY